MQIKKILVVDSQMDNRLNLELILFAEDFEVITAPSLEIALHCAELEQPDLILLNADLPGIDGDVACERFSSSPVTQEIPVVLVVGDHEHDPRADHASGVIAAPPYKGEDILSNIRRLESDGGETTGFVH